MKSIFKIIILVVHILFMQTLFAQEWKFIKERDDIKIYTRSEPDTRFKSFKGEIDLKTSIESLSDLLEKVEDQKNWDKQIKDIKLLKFIEDSLIRYYVVYNVQWPFSERDLCIEAKITQDTITGKRIIKATLMENKVPEKPGIVRITYFWQKWTMEPSGSGIIHLTLEGSLDPGGSIPIWLANLAIADTPLNIMRNVREQVAK